VSVGYLTLHFHEDIHNISFTLELLLFTIITLVNLRGTATAGRVEFLVAVINISVLLAIPISNFFVLHPEF
jgi:APA family basic amino acid/polyamine antiporter